MPIKLNDITKLSNGAQFYAADLHVHTYQGSHDVFDATMTPEAVVDQAVKDGITLLAITDHNSIRNSQRAIDYAQAKHAGTLLVLAAIEVTTAHGHLLVYFAPDAVHQLTTFVGRINVVQPNTKESHTAMSMADVATEAQRLGGICVAAHIDRKTGFESGFAGYPNWKKDVVTHPGILGVEVKDTASLIWYSADDEQTDQGNARKRLLEARGRSPGAEARATFAHVQNSDAHNMRDFIDAHAKRSMTRFKMDAPSFEGLRTALADPDARVRVEAVLPTTVPVILGVHVEGGFLHGETYRISDNLTCFIGGRGTGKSTALKCIAHGLGIETDLAEFDNCPDSVVVYCRDGQGITYRYERMRGGDEPAVQAYENGKVIDASVEAFRVEYYGQGDLQRVAADPLSRADLFQAFLDRHTHLTDLTSREEELIAKLGQNGALLRPMEAAEATRAAKDKVIADCDRKLKVAEEGQLKAIAARQAAVGAEKALSRTVDGFRGDYAKGISLENFLRDYDAATRRVGALTGDPTTSPRLAAMKAIVDETNASLRRYETEINALLKSAAGRLQAEIQGLATAHRTLDQGIGQKTADLQKAGLSGSVADLQKIIETRGQNAKEVARLDERKPELLRIRKERETLLAELASVRADRDKRRRDQIREINRHLAKSIDDYTVVVVYEDSGLFGDFLAFVKAQMQGSYFPEDTARRLCAATTPTVLAAQAAAVDLDGVAKVGSVGAEWAEKLVERLGRLEVRHALEVLDKPPAPIIRVVTKSAPAKRIPVNQLSDGQRHTILLTIAMLAESEVPLVIDQPEDDLDNAFVFSSIVRMLRDVKGRRQVIVVTHNANIAVLGDAEMLYPMRRSSDRGTAFDSGSVDRPETKAAVQSILEGGQLAFLRRKEIYGH